MARLRRPPYNLPRMFEGEPPHRAASIFAQYLARKEAGEEVDFEELCRDTPDIADELRVLHTDLGRWSEVLGALGVSGSLEQRIKDKFGENVDPTITLEPEDSPTGTSDFSAAEVELERDVASTRWPRAR